MTTVPKTTVVPVEATRDQQLAMQRALLDNWPKVFDGEATVNGRLLLAVYEAALAAAPQPVSPPVGDGAAALLTEAAEKFRFYEAQHRVKNTPESLVKAEVNNDIAGRIEAFLSTPKPASYAGAVDAWEPVAWLIQDDAGTKAKTPDRATTDARWAEQIGRYEFKVTPLYAHPPAAPEVALDREKVARALGLYRHRNHMPPVRWPIDENDRLSDRDGTVPLTWEFAEACRAEADDILALRSTDTGEK